MDFRILGPLEVIEAGRPLSLASPQQRAILALLIINANRVVSADRIVDAVWNGDVPGSGTKVLAFHISRLRDALSPRRKPGSPAGGLATERGGYVLRVGPDQIDAVRFERLAGHGHALLATDPATARAQLNQGLAMWRGEPLADVAYAEFAQAEISRLEEIRLAALEDRFEADLALGQHLTVIGELEGLVQLQPMRERLRGLLMLALYRSGRQAEALRASGVGRRLLSEQLGIDPSPELVRLEQQILAHDRELDLPAAPGSAGLRQARNPYKGLRAFEESDRADFFGREALVRHLADRLRQVANAGHLLVVAGPSGSGKSSAVKAGLLPALRETPAGDAGRRRIVAMRPGSNPMAELASALAVDGRVSAGPGLPMVANSDDLIALVKTCLAKGESSLLLIIDQFEELFGRASADAGQRFATALVGALTAPASPLTVIATLRADFLDAPLAMTGLGELVRAGTELVAPMTRDELERAIVKPAAAVGVEVEPGLVAEMINDVERQPGGLPLLEYALTELFDRGGSRLTREAYAAIGGVTGALGRRADEAWRALDRESRAVAQQILLDLVALNDGDIATTRRVPRAELESLGTNRDRAHAVIDELGRRGLLTFDVDPVSGTPTVQVAHEALLVHWSRMADWIDDLRQDLWVRRRLAEATDEWLAAERAADFLAAGVKLSRFETWARTTQLQLTEEQAAFLSASQGERDRLAALESERTAREARLQRRSGVARRLLVGVVSVALVLAGGLVAALVGQQQTSDEASDIAFARQVAAAAIGTLGSSRQLNVLLALQAADVTTKRGYVVEEAYDALQWSLQEAQVQFPAGELPVAVRRAPEGPRGVFLVAPEALMGLGAGYVQRSLTSDECRVYVHAGSCAPVAPPDSGTRLAIRTANAVVSPAALAVGALTGTHVRVLSELPADLSPLARTFTSDSGIEFDWQPAMNGDLAFQIDARELPDIAIVARPSYVVSAAHDGWLLDLDGLVDVGSLRSEVGDYAMGLGAFAGRLYGAPFAASANDLLWYPKDSFAAAGYRPPSTTAELDDLVTAVQEADRTPWCFGVEAGAESGAPAAAWLEDLFLDANGTQAYDGWVNGEIPFSGPEMQAALDDFRRHVTVPGAVYGGLANALGTPDRIAALPMLLPDGPGCWLYRGSSTDLTNPGPSLSGHAAAVPFPAPGAAHPALGRLYMIVALNDRPEVRQALAALLGGELASDLASSLCDTGVFPARNIGPPADCPVGWAASRLHAALQSGDFRVHALDLLPARVVTAFLSDVSWYLDRTARNGAAPDFEGGWSADGAWAELGG